MSIVHEMQREGIKGSIVGMWNFLQCYKHGVIAIVENQMQRDDETTGIHIISTDRVIYERDMD